MSDNTSTAMVSRSLRLHKETILQLEEMARYSEMGITVYIRHILESYVHAANQTKQQLKMLEELVVLEEEMGFEEA